MRIGVIREIKDQEFRVALTPAQAHVLITGGHEVAVEHAAGAGAGYSDQDYADAGALLCATSAAWASDLVLKIKEPLPSEYTFFDGQMLFTYLHLAGVSYTLTMALVKAQMTAIAYENVTDDTGRFPLLAPMSAIAGNMAASVANFYLARTQGGKGIQLGNILGERHGRVLVIGDGTVGQHAARTADALGAKVTLFGRRPDKAAQLRSECSAALEFHESTAETISTALLDADAVIGAVLLPGARAPHVVTEAMVKSMQAGSVIVDVSIDQGGCIETSQPTHHSDPVYVMHDVVHYAVTNMPGAYPHTATKALTQVTFPYIQSLADKGIDALQENTGFAAGVNVHQGMINNRAVATTHQLDKLYQPFTI